MGNFRELSIFHVRWNSVLVLTRMIYKLILCVIKRLVSKFVGEGILQKQRKMTHHKFVRFHSMSQTKANQSTLYLGTELPTVIVTSTLEVPVLLVVSVHTTVRMTDDGMAPLSMLQSTAKEMMPLLGSMENLKYSKTLQMYVEIDK